MAQLLDGVPFVSAPATLFNSTSSHPLALWAVHCDPADDGRSRAVLLRDDNDEVQVDVGSADIDAAQAKQPPSLIGKSLGPPGRRLGETVLQLQGPDVRRTFMRCPPQPDLELGVKLPLLHLHACLLDHNQGRTRPFALEVGVRDSRQQLFRIRLGTHHADVRLCTAGAASAPLLLVPLHTPEPPAKDAPYHQLAASSLWLVAVIDVVDLLQRFNDGRLRAAASIPTASRFASISYIKVHANARLRRIWAADRVMAVTDLPEYALLACE